MSFKYECKSGVSLVELAVPGREELVVISEGKPFESDTPILDYPADSLKETETKESKGKAPAEEEGGES